MGPVLGPIYSNFYMSDLENKVCNTINKPNIYLRYTDNILFLTNSTGEINIIQETFQNNSILNFSQEININNKIQFLSVLIIIIIIMPHPCSPRISIIHHSREVFQATSCIGTELLHIVSGKSSSLCLFMWWDPQEYIAYEFVLTSPAVSQISGSSNLDSFHGGW